MLENLKKLYLNPVYAWKEIDKIYFKNKWIIIKENLTFFLLINPLLFLFIHITRFDSLKIILFNGIIYPFILNVSFIFFLIILSLLIEEIYRITSYRDPLQNIFKLLVYSSLPFFSLYGFLDIPVIGKYIFLTGIIYSGYLIKIGIDKFLWANKSSRRKIFLIASFTAFLCLIVCSLLLFFSGKIIGTSILKLLT
ncbi:MAG: hypothetical protein OEV78_08240 [Spirochaetia bacterium]|nr:hypothetical protein [Spirochaetia bacterium]